MMILGIDVGGSTTKIVGVEDGQIRSAQSIVAADPVTSLFGALGKYIYDNGIDLSDISRIMLTGVGSAGVYCKCHRSRPWQRSGQDGGGKHGYGHIFHKR